MTLFQAYLLGYRHVAEGGPSYSTLFPSAPADTFAAWLGGEIDAEKDRRVGRLKPCLAKEFN